MCYSILHSMVQASLKYFCILRTHFRDMCHPCFTRETTKPDTIVHQVN